MARLQAGAWGERFKCASCMKNPSQKNVWGHSSKMTMHEHYWPLLAGNNDDEIIQLSSCPFRYVPVSVIMWAREYRYYKDFPSAPMPKYERINPRWAVALMVYENEYFKR